LLPLFAQKRVTQSWAAMHKVARVIIRPLNGTHLSTLLTLLEFFMHFFLLAQLRLRRFRCLDCWDIAVFLDIVSRRKNQCITVFSIPAWFGGAVSRHTCLHKQQDIGQITQYRCGAGNVSSTWSSGRSNCLRLRDALALCFRWRLLCSF